MMLVDVHEGREALEGEGLDRSAIGVSEHEETFGQWAEEVLGFIDGGGNQEGDAYIGLGVPDEDALCGVEDPGTLKGERVDDDQCEMEIGGPLGDGSGPARQRSEFEIGWHVSSHEARR